MSSETLVAPLMRVRMFQGLTPRQLGEIARRAERIMYRAGALITEEGDPADAAVLIVDGACERIATGLREPVEPGSLIGELAMIVDHRFGATVVARGPVKALRIPRTVMHDMMAKDQALADHIVEQISSKMAWMLREMQAIDSGLEAQQQRIVDGIDRIANDAGFAPAGRHIPSQATH